MKEIFLLKLGEIVLKGANKRQFEDKLRQNVRRRMRPYGNFDVYLMQSTIYVEPMDDEADIDGAWDACHTIFGLVSLCRCRACEKDIDSIYAAAEEYLGDDLNYADVFVTTGGAFRFTWNEKCWDMSNVDIYHTFTEGASETVYSYAAKALGRKFEILDRTQATTKQKNNTIHPNK